MRMRVISLCWSILLVINTTANAHSSKDSDDVPEYEIHNLHDSEISGNKEHIKEHLDHLDEKDLEKMSDAELAFHFFNSHDYNRDLRLDGLEILSSLAHSFTEDHALGPPPPKEHTQTMSEAEIKEMQKSRHEKFLGFLADLIDNVLEQSDKNNDGYLEYAEYLDARQQQKQQNEKDNVKTKHKHKHAVKGH